MLQYKPQGKPSRRGALFRELIAAGVKATGGDILQFAKKYEKMAPKSLPIPHGWHFEKEKLSSGGFVEYLEPKNCRRKDVVIMQLHGGGYTLGFLPEFRRRSEKLARLGGDIPVLSLDYRIAPEYPYPAALEDAFQAVDWLRQTKGIPPESIVTIGESAGAGLSLALAMRLRDEDRGSLRALVLMSPWTDLTCSGDSYESRYYLDPMFGRKTPPPDDTMRTTIGEVYARGNDLKNPYLSPAFGEFSGLPPMLIHVGEYEMLFDDAAIVYKKGLAAGLDVEFKVWPGMFHAFQVFDFFVPEARVAWREIGIYLHRFLG